MTDDGLFRVKHDGVVVAEIPGQRLVDDCPIYHPEAREATEAAARRAAEPAGDLATADLLEALRATARHAQHRQQAVGVRAVRLDGPGLDR